MQQHFYSDLVKIESLHVELSRLDMKDDERDHLVMIVTATIHHSVLDTILSELSDKDKKIFLWHLSTNHNENIWKFLDEHVKDAKKKIKKVVRDILEEFATDIKGVKA